MKYSILIIYTLLFESCLYKAGNRVKDIDKSLNCNLNVYFIRQLAIKEISSLRSNVMQTSEEINNPDNFFSIYDSITDLTFCIEHDFTCRDSITSKKASIKLHSVYDNYLKIWISDESQFAIGNYDRIFIEFMRYHFLYNVRNTFKHVSNEILYNDRINEIYFEFTNPIIRSIDR
jgi:hypothetical protein